MDNFSSVGSVVKSVGWVIPEMAVSEYEFLQSFLKTKRG